MVMPNVRMHQLGTDFLSSFLDLTASRYGHTTNSDNVADHAVKIPQRAYRTDLLEARSLSSRFKNLLLCLSVDRACRSDNDHKYAQVAEFKGPRSML